MIIDINILTTQYISYAMVRQRNEVRGEGVCHFGLISLCDFVCGVEKNG